VSGSKSSMSEEDAGIQIVRADAANHYTWGQGADGWRLVDRQDLSVIEESVPPGGAETLHEHRRARQFFYVLSGQLEMRTSSHAWTLGAGDGIEVPPGVRHQFANAGAGGVRFIVISWPPSRGDRTEAAPPPS